jgi:lycopene cyclase domain-containing protein
MKYSYLLLNLFTVLFPIALSFDKRVRFIKSWKFVFPAILITGLIFLFWDVLFTAKGVWSFNPRYITGLSILHLPLEEVLFFFTVPFACMFIYACLNYYFPLRLPNAIAVSVSSVIALLSIALLIIYHDRVYTAVTFGLMLVLLVILQFILKANWLCEFYRAYLVALIPFYIVNGILTSVPIVIYNNAQNMAFRAGTIPFEDHFYLMALLLMNIGLFEYFKNRAKLA